MIDIRLIRENPELVKENIKKRFQNHKLLLVDKVRKLDEEWRRIKKEEDSLRNERNKISQEINQAKKQNDEKKVKDIIKKAKEIPEKIEKLQKKREKLELQIKKIMLEIPNIIHPSVPIGKDETQNVEIKKIGKPKLPKYKIFNHGELAEKLDGVDFNAARKISGKGFYYLKGNLALLSAAMINFARDYMIKQGFEYIEPPFMVRKKVLEGVMSFEEMDNMIYKIENEDLYLIGTAEHPLIGMFMDKTLNSKELPIRITGFSPCFRKEIGSHGIDEKGFYRLHQFNKQEMIVICSPDESYKWYDKMMNYTINIFKALNIPIRVLEICSGDLADLKAKSCDIEAWSPRQKAYFEVASLTNMEEAQARRLNIKAENKGKRYFVHTLNNTVIAVPRAIRFLMENNQQKDGSIKIPPVLRPYMHGTKIIKIKNGKDTKT